MKEDWDWYHEYCEEIEETEFAMKKSSRSTKGGFKVPETQRLKSIQHKDTTKALKMM